jgi:hypothetical protein
VKTHIHLFISLYFIFSLFVYCSAQADLNQQENDDLNVNSYPPLLPAHPDPCDGAVEVPINIELSLEESCLPFCGISNGGFEDGVFSPWTTVTGPGDELEPWNVTSGGTGSFENGTPFEGSYFAQNGFDGSAGLYYEIYQEVEIPPCSISAVLSWAERIQWDMVPYGATLAREYVVSLQPSGGGAPLAVLYSLSLLPETSGDTGYVTHSIDLLDVAPGISGQTVRINFYQYIPEDFTGPAQFDLDGISLTFTYPAGPIAHWKFDEGGGDIAYDSACVNHGTLVNGPQWTTGQINGALDFDGVDDYVEIGDKLNNVDVPFSIGTWVNIHQEGTSFVFVSDDALFGNYDGFWLAIGHNYIQISYGDGTGRGSPNRRTKRNDVSIPLNAWVFVTAVVRGATDMDIYLNGADMGGTYSGSGGPMIHNTNKAVIGKLSTRGPYYFNGIVDDVKIYDRALSTGEVEQLYLDGLPELIGLEIVGLNEVAEDFQVQYTAVAYYDNNGITDVTDLVEWSVEPNDFASIENGSLSTGSINRPEEQVIVRAQYPEDGNSIDAEKEVTIFAICSSGTALEFDGQNDYVIANIGITPKWTMMAWVKADLTKGSGGTEILSGALVNDFVVPGGLFKVYVNGWLSSGVTLTTGIWYHLSATYDGTTLRLFINGEEKASDVRNIWSPGGPLYMGRYFGGNHFYGGIIDDVRIYNRALSAEEIRDTMHIKLNGDEEGLVAYWDFDEGSGQVAYDSSLSPYNDGYLGSDPCDVDSSDPEWIESGAPAGICTPCGFAERELKSAYEYMMNIMQELEAAMGKEANALGVLEELLGNKDYCDLSKKDLIGARVKANQSINREETGKKELEKSIERLKDSLMHLGSDAQ